MKMHCPPRHPVRERVQGAFPRAAVVWSWRECLLILQQTTELFMHPANQEASGHGCGVDDGRHNVCHALLLDMKKTLIILLSGGEECKRKNCEAEHFEQDKG